LHRISLYQRFLLSDRIPPLASRRWRLAGVIRYLASHIDDAGIRGRIEAATMDAERAKIQKLKSAATPP